MRRSLATILALAIAASSSNANASTPANETTLTLHRRLAREKGNVFFSGASLRTALAMAALGAKGPTFDELARTLDLPHDAAKIAAAEKQRATEWQAAAGKTELVIANRLWLDQSAPLEEPFATQATEGFGAAPESVDFIHASEPTRARINAWVTDTTKGKIKDLLPRGSIQPATRLVLTNAIYFKGSWATPFDPSATKDAPFHPGGAAIDVPMMHRTSDIAYGSTETVELVQLDYQDSNLAMLIALPRQGVQLTSLERKITNADVDAWAKSLSPQRVDLTMPKFTYSWGRSVKSDLQALGVKKAFSTSADFTGMTKQKGVFLSDVFHKAFVLVDETGTEAAAATGGVVTVTSLVESKVVRVDRPFLFFVRNKTTGDILFDGRVVNPKA